MPFPFSRQSNSSKRRAIPGVIFPQAAPGTITSVTHGALLVTVVFAQAMDTTAMAPPAGWIANATPITAVSWTNSTTAVLTCGTNAATNAYSFPATNTLRTAAGGAIVAKSGVLA